MASNYTNLGVQLMTTGEKAGTWGTLTNTNWNIIEQISGGYVSQSIAGGAQTTTLVKSDGSTGATMATRIWNLNGAITGNQIVTVPDSIENWWIIRNATTDSSDTYTVQVKTVSGSGITYSAGTAGRVTKLLYTDGTNVLDASADFGEVTLTGTQTLTNKTLTLPVITSISNSGTVTIPTGADTLVNLASAQTLTTKTLTSPKIGTDISDTNGNELIKVTATGSAVNEITLANAAADNDPRITLSGTSTNIGLEVLPKGTGALVVQGNADQGGQLRLYEDTDLGVHYTGFKPGNLTETIVYTLPLADAVTSGDALTSNASDGTLSWTTMSGGTSWQAVDTTGFTAVAGEGYFCNTTSGAFTATLPASPTIGDECTFVDYAGTFDSNNLTVGRNSEKINGASADLTVAVERAAFTLVYTDGTQGWLLKDK
jgi:hypothetical protein